MANFSQLVNEVADDINRTDLTAQCSAALAMAIRHYDRKRYWFNEGSATFTTTSATSVYALASDFRKMDYVEARWPGDNWQEVNERTFPYIKRMLEGQNVTGYPQDYVLRDRNMWIAYQPNGNYLVRYYYVKALPGDLTASASNVWTVEAPDLIRAKAAKTVALRTLHDLELAATFAEIIDEEELRITERAENQTSRGRSEVHY